jgi:hypothetical protein
MGAPLDRSRRVFAPLTESFETAFPRLQDGVIEFKEFNFCYEEHSSVWSLRRSGGQMACANPKCFRGGYEFECEVHDMIREMSWRDQSR